MNRTYLQIKKENDNTSLYTYEDLVKDCEGITNPLDEDYEKRIKRVQSVFFHDVQKALKEEEEEKVQFSLYKKKRQSKF